MNISLKVSDEDETEMQPKELKETWAWWHDLSLSKEEGRFEAWVERSESDEAYQRESRTKSEAEVEAWNPKQEERSVDECGKEAKNEPTIQP